MQDLIQLDDRTDWLELRSSADPEAFRSVVVRHQRAIYNYCFRRLGSWDAAQDATQATLTDLWRLTKAHRLDELEGDSARWMLLRMAYRHCQTQTRSDARRDRLTQRVAGQIQSTTDNTNSWVEAEATMAQINQLLAALSSGQRDVIELVGWVGLSINEAADVLGVAPGTIKSRLSRARELMAGTPAAHLVGDQS